MYIKWWEVGVISIDELRQAEMAHIKTHLRYFIESYVHIEDKDADETIQPFHLWPRQTEALESIHANRLNIILKARQLGITWLTLAYASHALLTSPGHLTIALSRTEDEAKELVRRLGVIYRNMPELVREANADNWTGPTYRATALSIEITHPGKPASTLKAFASSSGAARSFTANLLLLDEWAFQQFAQEIWLSAYPTINRPTGGKVVGLSTIERGTLFEELFTGDNGFNKIFLPWHADPRRTQEWYDQTKKDLGDAILQEYPATIEEALTIPGGSYFPEFKRHIHVIEGEPTPNSNRYVSMDYGLDMFAVLWYEVDERGNATVYRELHEKDLIVSEAAKALLNATHEPIKAYYAPPDLWNRNRDTGRSTAEVFHQHGITLTKTDNAREQGCLNIKEWLVPIQTRHEQTGEPITTAKLRIYDGTAPNLVSCLTKIQKDKQRPNMYANEPHELTHIVDSLRAFCVGRPRPTEIPKPRKVYNFDFEKPKPSPVGYGADTRVI